MTTATARRAPARSPARRPAKPARPNLRVVTPVPSRAPRAPFVLFSLLLVGSGLVALLYLNTVVAQDAFTIHDLDRGTAELAEREQRLRHEIADLESPQDLAAKARALGLVPAGDPVFVTPNGKVLGHAVPVAAPSAAPAAGAKPAATKPAATKPSAAPSASAKPAPGKAKAAKPAARKPAPAKPSPAPSAEPKP